MHPFVGAVPQDNPAPADAASTFVAGTASGVARHSNAAIVSIAIMLWGQDKNASIDRRARRRGLTWAVLACPVIGWFALYAGDRLTHGRLGVTGALLIVIGLPALLAAAGNEVLRRSRRSLLVAAVLAAFVCAAGLVLVVLLFLLTVPDDFFA